MPWPESVTMQRLQFVTACLKGDTSVAELCRRFNISRKTGYKWLSRFSPDDISSLSDHSRARHHQLSTPLPTVELLLEKKQQHPTWGPEKIRQLLLNMDVSDVPAASTIGGIFKVHGLTKKRNRLKYKPKRSYVLHKINQPNDVWSADFKGKFTHTTGRWCHPFTLTDNYSRMVLACDATYLPDGKFVIPCLERVFHECGLPQVLRTDNGPPFAGAGLWGLSQMSIWLIKCGVTPERIRPGKPTENGRHERMHRTMKEGMKQCHKFASLEEQQTWLNTWRKEFNEVRPHKALGGKTPQSVWCPSPRIYTGAQKEMPVPKGAKLLRVEVKGDLWFNGRRIFLSEALRYEWVWMKEVDDDTDEIGFGELVLARYDRQNHRIIRAD
ncbi:integrase [Gibbsiella quercinecans]|uniref:Integrase n=2 Tax=Gibbsiella quercinecans TaxID=929813 RepID=A0A250B4W2_9GAMM|nr:integrase [Gibbsiella quercinecans]RLM03171.1 integrase [Gibbsiella quercinecans]